MNYRKRKMQKLEHDQLLSMLLLQDQLNSRVDPAWVQNQNQWMRAAWIEMGEFMDHVGWKWWKKQEPNMPQARIELVDVWHFMLSEWLQHKQPDDTMEDVAALLLTAMYDPDKWPAERQAALDKRDDVRVLVDTFVHMCAANIFNVPIFARIMELCDMSWAELYRSYVAKNVLNTFRQDNGYKEGTYSKTWLLDGIPVEDNEVLERIMSEHPSAKPEQVSAELAIKYSSVLNADDQR